MVSLIGGTFAFIIAILTGALAGWLAASIMKKKGSMIFYIIIGIVGSFIGGIVFNFVGFKASGLIASIIVSVIGACILLFIIDKLFKK